MTIHFKERNLKKMKFIKKLIVTFTITGFYMEKTENGFDKKAIGCEVTEKVTDKNAEKILAKANGFGKSTKVYVESITKNENLYKMSVEQFKNNSEIIPIQEHEIPKEA